MAINDFDKPYYNHLFRFNVAVSNSINFFFEVYANNAQEALDIFVDGPEGHLLEDSNGDVYLGTKGKRCNLDNVIVEELSFDVK